MEFTETNKESLLTLKADAEEALKDFKIAVKQINAMGFNVVPQADDTLYVFKDHREAYGSILPTANVQQGVNNNHAGQH